MIGIFFIGLLLHVMFAWYQGTSEVGLLQKVDYQFLHRLTFGKFMFATACYNFSFAFESLVNAALAVVFLTVRLGALPGRQSNHPIAKLTLESINEHRQISSLPFWHNNILRANNQIRIITLKIVQEEFLGLDLLPHIYRLVGRDILGFHQGILNW